MPKIKQKSRPNRLHPGLPGYKGPTVGWFALLHHHTLIEFSWNVMERVEYVKENKPTDEIDLRLRHMLYIKPYTLEDGLVDFSVRPTREEVLKLLKKHVPRCKWVEHSDSWGFLAGTTGY
jgi:hypothetical protein